mmetsp:Transcript_143056/g.263807  ORF Transcript_143056/g.263807 Transcript_143056/m.263807 type:complete len:212 (-) Transcript_143056:1036-1671(-)
MSQVIRANCRVGALVAAEISKQMCTNRLTELRISNWLILWDFAYSVNVNCFSHHQSCDLNPPEQLQVGCTQQVIPLTVHAVIFWLIPCHIHAPRVVPCHPKVVSFPRLHRLGDEAGNPRPITPAHCIPATNLEEVRRVGCKPFHFVDKRANVTLRSPPSICAMASCIFCKVGRIQPCPHFFWVSSARRHQDVELEDRGAIMMWRLPFQFNV